MVEIVAESNTNILKEFLKEINIKSEPIEVDSIDLVMSNLLENLVHSR